MDEKRRKANLGMLIHHADMLRKRRDELIRKRDELKAERRLSLETLRQIDREVCRIDIELKQIAEHGKETDDDEGTDLG